MSFFRDQATLLLSNLAEGKEVRSYLQQFSATADRPFAVLKIGGSLLSCELDRLARQLALLQSLGLVPVVVFGAGPQLNEVLKGHDIAETRRDGLRVTPAGAMPIIAREVARTGFDLVRAIIAHGGKAALVAPGTITAQIVNEEKYGCVGDAVSVDRAAIENLWTDGIVPLVSCVNLDESGQMLNVNADSVARRIALELQPLKIVFLTGTGGLLNAGGQIIDSINLVTDYDELMSSDQVDGGMRLKLQEIRDLLLALPLSSSVSMTDAQNMLKELFTYGGAGTLIRQGERVQLTKTPDKERLAKLLERAFGRRLVPDYWENLGAAEIVISENYRAAAILTRKANLACLDKFAVVPAARGEGLAKAVWRRLAETAPSLIWRASPGNPINAFYKDNSDGFLRLESWNVFWRGAELNAGLVEQAQELAAAPADFVEASL